MASVAIPAALAVGGAVLEHNVGDGEGGGGGGGAQVSPTNPASFTLADLFGLQVLPGGRLSGTDADRPFGIFSDFPLDEAILRQLRDFPGLSGFERGLQSTLFGEDSPLGALLGETQAGLAGLVPFAQEAAETGFRTDATPFFNEAVRRLERDVIPAAAETVGFAPRGSPFAANVERGAADLLGQAALTNVELADIANARRLSGIPLATNTLAANAAFPVNFAADILGLGNLFRNVDIAQQASPLNTFAQLAGLGQNQQFLQQGFNPVDATSQSIGALAAGLGGAAVPFFSGPGGLVGTPPFNPGGGGGDIVDIARRFGGLFG